MLRGPGIGLVQLRRGRRDQHSAGVGMREGGMGAAAVGCPAPACCTLCEHTMTMSTRWSHFLTPLPSCRLSAGAAAPGAAAQPPDRRLLPGPGQQQGGRHLLPGPCAAHHSRQRVLHGHSRRLLLQAEGGWGVGRGGRLVGGWCGCSVDGVERKQVGQGCRSGAASKGRVGCVFAQGFADNLWAGPSLLLGGGGRAK